MTGRVEHRLASGSLASVISCAVSAATTLLQVPILLSVWTPEQFGLWIVVLATYSLIIVLDFGHQEFVSQRLILAGASNVSQIRVLVGSAVRVALLLGVLEVVVAVALIATPLARLGPTELTAASGVARQASIALIALVVYFATFGSVGGVLVRLYVSHGMFARSVWIGVSQRLVTFLAIVAVALMGGSLIGVALSQIAVGTIFAVFVFVDIRQRFPSLWPWWQSGSLAHGIRNLQRSLILTVASGAEQLGSSALLTLSGRLSDPLATASFSTQRTVGNTANQVSTTVLLPVIPEVGRYISSAQPDKVRATIAVASMLATGPTCITATALAPLIPWAYQTWTANAIPLNEALLATLVVAALIRQWQAPMGICLNASNAVVAQGIVSVSRTGCALALVAAFMVASSSVLLLGVAVLVAELVSAAVSLVLTHRVMHRIGTKLPADVMGLSALEVMVTGLCLSAGLLGALPWVAIVPVCVGVLTVLVLLQVWRLPPDARHRLSLRALRQSGPAQLG